MSNQVFKIVTLKVSQSINENNEVQPPCYEIIATDGAGNELDGMSSINFKEALQAFINRL